MKMEVEIEMELATQIETQIQMPSCCCLWIEWFRHPQVKINLNYFADKNFIFFSFVFRNFTLFGENKLNLYANSKMHLSYFCTDL